jgi:cytoskeletal protein RodZ
MAKKITLGVIAIAIILVGIVFWVKIKSPKTATNPQTAAPATTTAPVAADKSNPAKAEEPKTPGEKAGVNTANYANASGTVTTIDTAQKSLTINTSDGKALTVKLTDATTVYEIDLSKVSKDEAPPKPQAKTIGDITKGETIQILYDSTNNSAISIMISSGKPAGI